MHKCTNMVKKKGFFRYFNANKMGGGGSWEINGGREGDEGTVAGGGGEGGE